MTPAQRDKLLQFISEYGDSLTRTDAERDQQKSIAARAVAELCIESAAFIKVATAYHKGRVEVDAGSLCAQLDLFDAVRGEPVA